MGLLPRLKKVEDIERGVWYKSIYSFPPDNLRVLCCYPNEDLFWIDFVSVFPGLVGKVENRRWSSTYFHVKETKRQDGSYLCWQLPLLDKVKDWA